LFFSEIRDAAKPLRGESYPCPQNSSCDIIMWAVLANLKGTR
jgi:hypothetical protein